MGAGVGVVTTWTGEADQAESTIPGEFDRQTRWRGHGRHQFDPGEGRLQDHFVARPARYEEKPLGGVDACQRQGTDQLVEGIVAPDVFAHGVDGTVDAIFPQGLQIDFSLEDGTVYTRVFDLIDGLGS